MRIIVEIDLYEVWEDEVWVYEKVVSSFVEEWLKLLVDFMVWEYVVN